MDTISKGSRRKLKLFSSIRTKFALVYFSVIAVLLVIMNTYFLTASRDMIFNSKETFLMNQAVLIATNISASFDNLTVEGVNAIMDRLDVDVTGLKNIAILGRKGNTIYDSSNGSSYDEPAFMTENVTRAINGFDVFFSRLTEGVFSSSAFTPVIDDEGSVIGVVYVHEYDSEQGAFLIGLQSTIKSISIAISIFSVAMVALIIRTLMHRITLILNAINSVREGEYNYPHTDQRQRRTCTYQRRIQQPDTPAQRNRGDPPPLRGRRVSRAEDAPWPQSGCCPTVSSKRKKWMSTR